MIITKWCCYIWYEEEIDLWWMSATKIKEEKLKTQFNDEK